MYYVCSRLCVLFDAHVMRRPVQSALMEYLLRQDSIDVNSPG